MGEAFDDLRVPAGKRKTIDLTDDAEEDIDHLPRTSANGGRESPKRLRAEDQEQSSLLPASATSAPSRSNSCENSSSGPSTFDSLVRGRTEAETTQPFVCASTSNCSSSSIPPVQADAESRRQDAIKRILGGCQHSGNAARVKQKQVGLSCFFTPTAKTEPQSAAKAEPQSAAKTEPQSAESSLTDVDDDGDLQMFDFTEVEPSSSSSSSSPFQPRFPPGAQSPHLSTCTSADLELALALQWEDNDDPELLMPQHVERPRPVQRRQGNLMNRLAHMDRDFTPEDYELLSGLDAAPAGSVAAPGRSGKAARSERKLLLDRFPKIILDKSSAGSECPICLEKMKPRMEARRLPCLHMFHRRCIDRWLLASDRPRCPVDQGELDFEI